MALRPAPALAAVLYSAGMVDLLAAASRAPFALSGEAGARLGIGPRRRQVLHLASCGRSNQQIAASMGVSLSTVKKHLAEGMRALRVRSSRALALACVLESAGPGRRCAGCGCSPLAPCPPPRVCDAALPLCSRCAAACGA